MSLALAKNQKTDFAAMRLNMIEGQLRPNGIRDERILSAMETISRERFLPPELAGICCVDEELGIAPNRGMLRPLVFARMAQALTIKPTDRVLDVGCATGYSTVVLAGMARHVVGLEEDTVLAKHAEANTQAAIMSNTRITVGRLTGGCPDYAPFDAILVNGAVEFVPESLFAQLSDGGRLAVVVRRYGAAEASHSSEIRLYTKFGGQVSVRPVYDATAGLLPGFAQVREFQF